MTKNGLFIASLGFFVILFKGVNLSTGKTDFLGLSTGLLIVVIGGFFFFKGRKKEAAEKKKIDSNSEVK